MYRVTENILQEGQEKPHRGFNISRLLRLMGILFQYVSKFALFSSRVVMFSPTRPSNVGEWFVGWPTHFFALQFQQVQRSRMTFFLCFSVNRVCEVRNQSLLAKRGKEKCQKENDEMWKWVGVSAKTETLLSFNTKSAKLLFQSLNLF